MGSDFGFKFPDMDTPLTARYALAVAPRSARHMSKLRLRSDQDMHRRGFLDCIHIGPVPTAIRYDLRLCLFAAASHLQDGCRQLVRVMVLCRLGFGCVKRSGLNDDELQVFAVRQISLSPAPLTDEVVDIDDHCRQIRRASRPVVGQETIPCCDRCHACATKAKVSSDSQ